MLILGENSMELCVVEVMSADVDERSGTNDRGAWQMRTQKAYLHQNEPYPAPFDLFLEKGQLPYPPGQYLFAGGTFSFYKGRWEFSRRVNLVPVDKAPELLRARLLKAKAVAA